MSLGFICFMFHALALNMIQSIVMYREVLGLYRAGKKKEQININVFLCSHRIYILVGGTDNKQIHQK